jgi:hypothetical protein
MYTYSWDFQEAGVASIVEQLRNVGINSVVLACSYHAGKFLRPKGTSGKVYFPEDGTTYFKINPKNYGAIKPVPNSKVLDGDVLADLTNTKDLSVRAWLVLLHNSRLGSENPSSAVHNAFGDPYIYALCPSAPDSRAYGVGLAKDVSDNYNISGLSIESIGFPPYEHGFHHEMSFVKPNKWLSSYLGLCFCKFCVIGAKKVGVDADTLKAQVAKNINEYLTGDIDYPADMAEAFWLADVLANSDLRGYLDFRNSVVTSLVQEIRASVRSDVEVAVIPSVVRPTAGAWYEGTDLKAIAEITGVIEACFYEPATERIQADLVDLKRRTENIGKIKGILRPAFPDLPSENAVVEAVQALAEGGVTDIGFYSYGHIRSQSLEWISAALKSKGTSK